MEQTNTHLRPSAHTYVGVFLVSLATLMHEILLTRIFSVTMWYHFAFVAISIAMFGMTVGALIVYLRPALFPSDRVATHLAGAATLFPVVLVVSFLTQLSIPFTVRPSIVALYAIVLTYVVIAVPFVVSGICMSLALTRYAQNVSHVYAADLAGAGAGCILLIYTLQVTDGPTAVFVVAFLAALGAVSLTIGARSARLRRLAVTSAALIGLFAVGHTALVWRQFPVLRILYIKGAYEARPLYEKWNSYSRVRVNGNPDKPEKPYAWGLSAKYPAGDTVRQLHLDVDVNAGTVMLAYDGRLDPVEHLKSDVTNVGYYLRPDASVLVVGTGGGRDVLSALAFGAKAVTGVELNRDIIATVNGRFGAFTGHLDRDPRVAFINDEARSYVARQQRQFDFIQISLIDTWAATAAGAFVLSENSLYTREAWSIFLSHLTDRGVLSVSRWYFRERPGEVYRLTTLATAALAAVGVENPRGHIIIVRNMTPAGKNEDETPDGVGTILVSRRPFAAADIDRIREVSAALGFDVVLSPSFAADETFAKLASGGDSRELMARFPINITSPTDDSPFFFQMLRLRDIFRLDLLQQGKQSHNMQAVFVLGALLLTVTVLTALCVFVPLILASRQLGGANDWSLLVFFAAIGLGFMLIETSQMQRLIIVLGHPTYGLSVVLFSLLLSSGIGSLLTQRVGTEGLRRVGTIRLAMLLSVLVLFGVLTPFVARSFEGAFTSVRIIAAAAMLIPPGLLMGMAFPLGMKAAARQSDDLTPWLWGINGAMSVLASVLSVAIALTWTISAAFWTGCACYLVAAVAFGRTAAGTDARRVS